MKGHLRQRGKSKVWYAVWDDYRSGKRQRRSRATRGRSIWTISHAMVCARITPPALMPSKMGKVQR